MSKPANSSESKGVESPLLLPPQIAASEDLTWQAWKAGSPKASAFDEDPIANSLFDNLARALHRRQYPNVLLVGERGVGKYTLIAELARRAALSTTGFLPTKRFLSVECRFTLPDETRPRLMTILAHVCQQADLVVCLDGLHGLLTSGRGGSNKPILLAALAHAHCHFLATLTPREHEDLAGDDPDFAEFFTKVDAPEPDANTALRLMRHFARGLSERYQVGIDPVAVDKTLKSMVK